MIAAALFLAATAPAINGPLEPLSFLVGHCWSGEFKARGQVDTHCFEAVYDGKHIRDRHEVTGGKAVYRGETIFSWNAEAKKVEYTYWNSHGGVSRGSMAQGDKILDFGDETHRLPDGRTMVIKTEWRLGGGTSYDVVSRQNGVTGERVVTYTRVD